LAKVLSGIEDMDNQEEVIEELSGYFERVFSTEV